MFYFSVGIQSYYFRLARPTTSFEFSSRPTLPSAFTIFLTLINDDFYSFLEEKAVKYEMMLLREPLEIDPGSAHYKNFKINANEIVSAGKILVK